MKSRAGLLAIGASVVVASTAFAVEPPPTPNYSGELMTRSTLTGDWGGTRNDLAAKGLTIDMYATQVGQGVIAGGLNNGWRYMGRGNITLTLDTGKAGLWPGGFFIVEGEGKWADVINAPRTGAILPVNNNALFPEAVDRSFVIPAVTYIQFLSPQFGVMLGKLDTASGDDNAFAHGKGDHGFMNTAFSFNPVTAVTVPSSTLGIGMLLMPTDDIKASVAVVDAEGRADTSGFDTAFKGGTTFTGEVRLTTQFFGMKGHQLVGGTYSDRLYVDLDNSLRNFIIPFLPVQEASGSWSAYYNFDQYIYQPDPKTDVGLGIFGRFGISDGDANPIHYFASIGAVAKGLIAGRKDDSLGIGYYRVCRSDSPALDTLSFGDSQGIEVFYECAVTPWMFVTPSIQVIDPSQSNVDTVYVAGLRLTVKF